MGILENTIALIKEQAAGGAGAAAKIFVAVDASVVQLKMILLIPLEGAI